MLRERTTTVERKMAIAGALTADRVVYMRTRCRRWAEMIDGRLLGRFYFTFVRFVLQMKISRAVYVTIDACYCEPFD